MIETLEFELECYIKNYLIRAKNEKERDKWFNTIKSLIEDNSDKKENKFMYENIMKINLKENLILKDLEKIPDILVNEDDFLKNKIEKALKNEKFFPTKKKA